MIRKIQYTFAAILIAAITLLHINVPSFASMADIVNQQLEENEESTDIAQPVDAVNVPQTVPSSESIQAENVNIAETEESGAPNGSYSDVQAVIDAINMLDPSNPDEYLINVIRASYDALPMSLQIQVSNVNILTEAEANLKTVQEGGSLPVQTNTFRDGTQGGNTRTETGENPYSGTEYTFNVREETHEAGLTLFIRFQEDLNGDGMGDTPNIAVMYPDSAEEMVMMNSASLSRDNATLTWAGEYLQIDIAHPESGMWTISTSLKCVFETRAYAGIPETFVSEEEKDTRQSADVFVPVNNKSYGSFDIKTILLLAGIGAALVVAIVIFLRALLPQKSKASKGKVQSPKGKKKSKKTSPEDDETSEAEEAKNEELRQIRADMERKNKIYEKEDAAYEEQKKKAEAVEERHQEEELDITVEDIDNDDAIEEYTDGFDTGILSKNWNDDGTTGDTGTLNSRFGK